MALLSIQAPIVASDAAKTQTEKSTQAQSSEPSRPSGEPSQRPPATAEDTYPIPKEAERREGVPQGKIEGPFKLDSQVYPLTVREYWLYIPAQYDEAKPICSITVQDGLNRAKDWRMPEILDNLIHDKAIPPMIGIFVNPGIVPSLNGTAQPRYNRSFEYDSLGDRYSKFLVNELLPEVAKSYNLSADPNDRALAGASSGGICAFNAAWERPDAFRRVISTIGTFVGLRGGNQLPMLVRKTEPKPLRIFLQDGSKDLNIYAGDWFIANQDMLSALKYAGYEVHHAWGEGGHNGRHGAAVMPEALKWLWADHPQPIKAGANPQGERRINILLPDSVWEQVSSGHELAEAPTCNAAGEVFFCDSRAGRIYRVGSDGKTRVFAEQTGRISSMAFGHDGKLYACNDGKQIVRFDETGKSEPFLADTPCQSIATMPAGFFFSDPATLTLYWSDYKGTKRKVDQLPSVITGIVPTPDHAFLHLGSNQSMFTWHYRISAEHDLEARQNYGYLHLPDGELSSGVGDMTVDTEGRVYVATKLGVQVLDQLGRVNLIFQRPSGTPATGISFGGPMFDMLYITCGEKVYRRKLNAQGAKTFEQPLELPKPRL